MGAVEKSLKVYDTKKTFFAKLGSTFSKLFSPTKNGITNILVGMKRNAVIKNYKNVLKAQEDKKDAYEKKFEEAYSIYLEEIDQQVVDSIYKKVRENTASDFEKEALSKYYNVIHLKDNDKNEYKYKKQIYLLKLDFNSLKQMQKDKAIEEYKPVYIYEMERLYKALLKHYSITLSEKKTPIEKEEAYNKVFDLLDDYVTNIIPLKEITDPELSKLCNLFETYSVGKLDQVDVLDKKIILLGISRKLFVHSLPLVVCEKCYIKLLKDTRSLIVDTKILRKRENAYRLLIRLIEEYNDRLLNVKIYWDDNNAKKTFNQFNEQRKALNEVKEKQGEHAYDIKKQILYIKFDMKALKKYGNKYYRILKFYKSQLVKLGEMREIKSCKTGNYKVVKGYSRKVIENEAAC